MGPDSALGSEWGCPPSERSCSQLGVLVDLALHLDGQVVVVLLSGKEGPRYIQGDCCNAVCVGLPLETDSTETSARLKWYRAHVDESQEVPPYAFPTTGSCTAIRDISAGLLRGSCNAPYGLGLGHLKDRSPSPLPTSMRTVFIPVSLWPWGGGREGGHVKVVAPSCGTASPLWLHCWQHLGAKQQKGKDSSGRLCTDFSHCVV